MQLMPGYKIKHILVLLVLILSCGFYNKTAHAENVLNQQIKYFGKLEVGLKIERIENIDVNHQQYEPYLLTINDPSKAASAKITFNTDECQTNNEVLIYFHYDQSTGWLTIDNQDPLTISIDSNGSSNPCLQKGDHKLKIIGNAGTGYQILDDSLLQTNPTSTHPVTPIQ